MADIIRFVAQPAKRGPASRGAAVVAAAQRLFIERGYGVATIEAISEAADVPVATVYRLFSSEAGS